MRRSASDEALSWSERFFYVCVVKERASGEEFGSVASCNREILLQEKLQGDFPIAEAIAPLSTRTLRLPQAC